MDWVRGAWRIVYMNNGDGIFIIRKFINFDFLRFAYQKYGTQMT